jgi:tetratricopeptide (TPR) repeat protein
MKERICMKDFSRYLTLTLGFMILVTISISTLTSITRHDNDLLFIISLYENRQYEIAKRQISVFENEYHDSEKLKTVLFIKANIALLEKRYLFADSLYDYLSGLDIDNTMRGEIWLNKSIIKYESREYNTALEYLEKSEKATSDTSLRFQIEMLRGKTQFALLNYSMAKISFEKSLILRHNDPAANLELVKTLHAMDEFVNAKNLVFRISQTEKSMTENLSVINVWLDLQISDEEFGIITEYEDLLQNKNLQTDESISIRFAKSHYLQKDYEKSLLLIKSGNKYMSYRKFIEGLIYLDQGQVERADSLFADISSGFYYDEGYLPDSNEDLVILSWLERVKILFETYPELALQEVKKYLSNFPREEQNPYVIYTYSSLLFRDQKYSEAINNLLYIKHKYNIREIQHNVSAMLGDVWYNAGIMDNANQAYNNYLNSYPKGKYRSHAQYNIALINFEKGNYDESVKQIDVILANKTNAEIAEKSRFLLAEIHYYKLDYNAALEHYKMISPVILPSISVDYRIAQCYYFLGNYSSAAEMIPRMITNSKYAFQVLMLDGNINFNQRKHSEAFYSYSRAYENAANDSERNEANSYKALSLYRLGRFSEASKIYLQLSQDKESPQAYFLMAAKTSYHAKDYQQSLLLFNQFTEDYPESEYVNFAMANIGSIYYNQKDYRKAILTWVDLLKRYKTINLFNEDEQVILASVFTGLQWCLRQEADEKILDDINEMIDKFNSEYIKFELQYLLLKVYFGSEQWDDIIRLADNLREQFPQKENNEIRKYVAASLSKLDRYEEADSIYRKVFEIEPNADVLTEWAELEFQAGKSAEAAEKLERALNMDLTIPRFVRLLLNLKEYLPTAFENYWYKWSVKFDPLPDQASNIWMNWNYENKRWQQAEFLARQLLLNPDYQIRSKAQFIAATSLYYTEDYDNAIVELYRTIYLYPESNEMVLQSKQYIVRAYLALGQIKEANLVYNEIRSSLSPEEQSELYNLILEKQ